MAQHAEAQSSDALFLKGRYEEAIEKYASVDAEEHSHANCLIAKCLAATGKRVEAISRLESLGKDDELLPLHPAAKALLAEYYFEQGQYDLCRKHIDELLKIEPTSIPARFFRAELHRVAGQFEKASSIYADLAETPIRDLKVDDADLVCKSLAIHGRWSRDTRVFDRLVNDLYPSLLQKNANYWPAHLASGTLFLEKFNTADAARELKSALAVNPRAAEVHVRLGCLALQNFDLKKAMVYADQALKINPKLISALQLSADIALVNLQPQAAFDPLERALTLNPNSESTLGRLFAARLRLDGLRTGNDPNSESSKLAGKVLERNQHCGEFYAAVGDAFEHLRIYPEASKYYEIAIEKMPQQIGVRGSLGMVQMRLGDEAAARQTLDESFQIDPFNVRVKNTLDVLDLLETYAVLETDHFVLRFDRGHDGVLAEYAARFLEEEVYPDIVEAIGYEPKDKTLLEIFSQARGTSGHAWFSARMVGLPFIGTVGACAGKMFALTSPSDGQSFNWARVLRHEFVHVVNLQQTNFLIPHWFTEAIAVRNENVGYPGDWERILAKYVSEDALFTLADINHGFVRPCSSERWTLAYFQAYLYADFIVGLAGEKALHKMLSLYADGQSTANVIKHVTKMGLDDFEHAYRKSLVARAEHYGGSNASPTTTRSIDELTAELNSLEGIDGDAESRRIEIIAQLAEACLRSGQTRKARRYAGFVLEANGQHPIANFVMARLLSSIGDDDSAWRHIERGLQQEQPHAKLLAFAANLKLAAREYAEASKLYRRGQEAYPSDPNWTRGLARVMLKAGDDDGLMDALSKIADREADKTTYARKLVQLALAKPDYSAAEKWANRVLHVDMMNPIAHAQLGKALAGQNKVPAAIREYTTALKLSPHERAWKQELEKLTQLQNERANHE